MTDSLSAAARLAVGNVVLNRADGQETARGRCLFAADARPCRSAWGDRPHIALLATFTTMYHRFSVHSSYGLVFPHVMKKALLISSCLLSAAGQSVAAHDAQAAHTMIMAEALSPPPTIARSLLFLYRP